MSIPKIVRYIAFFVILSGVIFASYSRGDKTTGHFPGQLQIRIQDPPIPLLAGNRYYLLYEIYLTNFQKKPITLTSLTIKGNNSQTFNFSGKALAELMYGIGMKNPEKEPLVLQPGASKLIFMWLSFSSAAKIPEQLVHEFKFNSAEEMFNPNATANPMNVNKEPLVIVSPPLTGKNWLAGNAPSPTGAHRTAHMVVHGCDYLSQRFAIDFVQLDEEGITHHGDPAQNKNYYCYGQDIHSVANGRVVGMKDGIPENIPHSKQLAVPITLDTISGNYVVVDIGNGKYAFYAHMIPGSSKVKVGDTVTRGQVLGRVGNTGNSTEPHLHFHIVDQPPILAGNGLPYAFDHFSVRPAKAIPDAAEEIHMRFLSDKLQTYQDQLVLENTVLNFS